jgi:hypothetical protein
LGSTQQPHIKQKDFIHPSKDLNFSKMGIRGPEGDLKTLVMKVSTGT